MAVQSIPSPHHLGSFQVEPGRERCKSPEQHPFRLGQQRVRPVHRCPECLLPAHCGPRSPGQQPETVVQPGGDFGRREHAQPRGGQFDRQRDPVQPAAYLADRGSVVRGDREIRHGAARPVGEQLDRLASVRQRRHPPGRLAVRADRLPARRHDDQPGAGPQELLGQHGARIEEMLAVIQHQQRAPGSDEPGHRLQSRPARLVRQSQSARHHDRDQGRIRERSQIDQPDPGRKLAQYSRRDL